LTEKSRAVYRLEVPAPPRERQSWPVFLVGSHRSGTTLVRFILDAHPRLACPPESKFISGIHALLEYPQAWSGLTSLGLSPEEIFAEIRQLVDRIMARYVAKRKKCRWIDKTPNYYRLLELIDRIYAHEVLYLILLRHPLDCIDSLFERYGAPGRAGDDPDVARFIMLYGRSRFGWAQYWNEANETLLAFSSLFPDRCHVFRYEELVAHPSATIHKVCGFLGESFTDDMLTRAFRMEHTEGYQDGKILGTESILATRVGKWRNWPKGEVSAIWRLVEDCAGECGYPHPDAGVDVPGALR
jgi:hypothetical protein